MSPRLPVRAWIGGNRTLGRSSLSGQASPPICFLCSLSYSTIPAAPHHRARRKLDWTRRAASTSVSAAAAARNPRADLAAALADLEKRASSYVDLSRIQLAIRGLEQQPGSETVRVAILGLDQVSESPRTAKELVRLLLADPLKAEQEWERELDRHDAGQPLIIRVGREEQRQETEGGITLSLEQEAPLKEIRVSSPALNDHNLELLVMEAGPISDFDAGQGQGEEGSARQFEEAVLVPTVEIPISSDGRFTPVSTPVHRALIVADGIMGAASVVSLPLVQDKDVVAATVNLSNVPPEETSNCPFINIDVKAATKGLSLVRQDLSKAMDYEQLWYTSNVPAILEWLRLGTISTPEALTKEPVRKLVASVLRDALSAVQNEEMSRLSFATFEGQNTTTVALNQGLSDWAEKAHTELQEQLDAAFSSRRWRKLGWWKLFWRADDVSMLSSEMISLRFLTKAERNIIFLAGRIEEAALTAGQTAPLTYRIPVTTVAPGADGSASTVAAPPPPATAGAALEEVRWPTNIAFTRNYLQEETVPALQALAQKLVVQTFGTSALMTSLAGLLYASSFGLSEAGAVAALGAVWSLRRLQKKWETAREFWEGEVREEGRKAVRAVEMSVGEVLDRSKAEGQGVSGVEDLDEVKELVKKAEDALDRLD